MSYRVVFMIEAERDMGDIEAYLSQFYASTVRKFFVQLEKQVKTLETMPFMYPAYREDPFFRKMTVNDYMLFYSVDEKRQIVIIHRIFHSSRDINKQIMIDRSER